MTAVSAIINITESTHYRSVCARVNFLAQDRPDLQFASKFASKFMSNPTDKAMGVLKRIGRYLKGSPRMVQHFHFSGRSDHFVGHADSDWAGSRADAKSTSGGTISYNGHLLKSWAIIRTYLDRKSCYL